MQIFGRLVLAILISSVTQNIDQMLFTTQKRIDLIGMVYQISGEYQVHSNWSLIFRDQVLLNFNKNKFDEDFKRIFQKLPQQMFDEVTNHLFY